MIDKLLGGRYKLEEKVGIGGMARVYRALDTLLNRPVAVKILKDEYMDDDDFLKQFAMEAQSAASLTHSNIVSVYDVGSSVLDDKKYNYIVMEYVDGKTLKEIIEERGPLPAQEIISYGIQIAKALECAHGKKIIHRDIKPQNILIDSNQNLKVTDFGIARISSSSTITYTSSVLGTVHYISPEQAKGKFIDEKSDIYSLGIVLYEMATGKVPFDAANSVGIALKHIQDPLIPPIDVQPNIPEGINDIIVKALEKNPIDRFQTASEVRSALKSYSLYKNQETKVEDKGKTARIGTVAMDEDNPKAVYKMNPTNFDEGSGKKKKPSFFKTYILPIFLALLLMVGLGYVYNNYMSRTPVDTQVSVPPLLGLTQEKASEIGKKMGLIIEIVGTEDSLEYQKGMVMKQDPKSEEKVEPGSTIKVTISSGPNKITVPNLQGLTIDQAKETLLKNNLSIGEVGSGFSDTYEKGIVYKQTPAFNESIEAGSSVSVTVSKGKEIKKIPMINLIGIELEDATSRLQKIGLSVGKITREYDDKQPENSVIWQAYSAGINVDEGTPVNLVVSRGKKPLQNDDTGDGTNNSNSNKTFVFNIKKPNDVASIYSLSIKQVLSNGEEKEVYNKKHNVSEGDFNIPINGNEGNVYKVYIDDVLVKTTN